jgi:IS605 OrfB family transposase
VGGTETGINRRVVLAVGRFDHQGHAPHRSRPVPLQTVRAGGLVGVDTNADHLAAWRLDEHGNPVGHPRRFDYDTSGTTGHRDAQLRHALIRLLHWAKRHRLAIAVEDLDFQADKTREKHGRRKRFRTLISGMPISRLRTRLVAMAAELGITIVAVDPVYTSKWGAQHWQRPLTTTRRPVTGHQAAAVAIGRRALGHPIRRRTTPPPHDQSDRAGHRTIQAPPVAQGVRNPAPTVPDHGHDPRRPDAERTQGTRTPNTVRSVRLSTPKLMLSLQER